MKYIDTKEFLELSNSIPIIDVRAPLEYENGHIPGAINIPLFSNEEREKIGTTYKHVGKLNAIEEGLNFVGPKMSQMAIRGLKVSKKKSLLVHCWRGGMRSKSMAWLFELMGLHCYVLDGGYKAYRKHGLDEFKNFNRFIILQGATGSGKTYIIKELAKQGDQVIDLEGLANHKGSAFGALGEANQPTTQQFQNNVFEQFDKLDKSKHIWLEGESRTIGKVYLPETLWDVMNTSRVVEINIPQEERVKHLLKDYGKFETTELIESVEKIRKRFGNDKTKICVELLQENKLAEVTKMLLDYYDKAYTFSRDKYKKQKPQQENFDHMNFDIIAKKLLLTAHKA
ncbi:MAG: tRNA 2-selenouridine(34) synthase MnmH [Bacteroidales bacterium]